MSFVLPSPRCAGKTLSLPDGLTYLYEDVYNMEVICKKGDQRMAYPLEMVEGQKVWCWQPAPGLVIPSGICIQIMKRPAAAKALVKVRLVGKQKDILCENSLVHVAIAKQGNSPLECWV